MAYKAKSQYSSSSIWCRQHLKSLMQIYTPKFTFYSSNANHLLALLTFDVQNNWYILMEWNSLVLRNAPFDQL
ncbi:hypothetical protein BLOT_009938 [Blomia tropicalis]|nr:hypothetical protein BLOT_009938 [Blomia tropicalis]